MKLHANQLAVSGGVQVGVKHHALSVDHLESTTDEEVRVLGGVPAGSQGVADPVVTMPTILPGASFFLRMQYGRANDLSMPVCLLRWLQIIIRVLHLVGT